MPFVMCGFRSAITAAWRHSSRRASSRPGGHPLIIAGAHYGANDAFFEARGHYSLFETCNEWTRRGLAAAGVRVPVWAPFDKALFYQLPSG